MVKYQLIRIIEKKAGKLESLKSLPTHDLKQIASAIDWYAVEQMYVEREKLLLGVTDEPNDESSACGAG